MISKKIIKPISISLIVAMLSPSLVSATSLDDLIMTTSTSAGSWTDPLGGGTYLYGGSFKIKLKNASYVAPPLSIRGPKASIGCSGISLDAGFIGFMGLDKLKQAVSNMGSSLMFGVMMGIEYTLPTIAAIIAKLRAWSNALQKLLQNGCNIGRAISKSTGAFGMQAHATALSSAIDGPFKGLNNFMGGGADDPKSFLSTVTKWGNCSGEPDDANCPGIDDAKAGIPKALKKAGLGRTSTPQGITAKRVSDLVGHPSDDKPVISVFNLNDFYTNDTIGCDSSRGISVTTMSDTDKLIDQLKFVFFGEIGANAKLIGEDAEKIQASSCSVDNSKMAKNLKSSASGLHNEFLKYPDYAVIPPILKEDEVVKFLLYGANAIAPAPYISGDDVQLKNRKVLYFDMPFGKDDAGHATTWFESAFVSAKTDGDFGPINIQWKGAVAESLYGIRAIVDSITLKHWRFSGGSGGGYSASAATSVNGVPLVIPSVKKYARIIANMEKRVKGETAETKSLKLELARVNAILFTKEFLASVRDRVMSLSESIHGNPEVINTYIKSINDRTKLIKKALDEIADDVPQRDLLATFKELEAMQKKDSFRTVR